MLFEADVVWLLHQPLLGNDYVLSECALVAAEDSVARLEPGDVLAHALHHAGEIHADAGGLRLAQPGAHQAHEVWRAVQEVHVVGVQRRCTAKVPTPPDAPTGGRGEHRGQDRAEGVARCGQTPARPEGADQHTIDYTQQDYTQGGTQYDLIIDNVGNHSLSANRRVLKLNGRYVMVSGPKGKWIKPMDRMVAAMIYSRFVHQEMGMMMARASKDDLALLGELMQQAKVTPVIDKTYKLSEAAEAMRDLETGRVRGKIVIRVD